MVVAGFVAPYLLDTTTRFVAAAADDQDARVDKPDHDGAARPGPWRATTVSDGTVIVRHPELARAMEIAQAFASRLQLFAE